MVKKLTTLFIAVIILVSCAEAAVCADDAVVLRRYFYESFATTPTGNVPGSLRAVPKSNSIAVAEYPSKTDKSICFSADKTASTDSFIEVNIEESADDTVIEFFINFKTLPKYHFFVYFKDPSNKEVFLLKVNTDLEVYYPEGISFSFKKASFQKISIVLSRSKHTASVYAGKTLLVANAPLNFDDFGEMKLLRLHMLSPAASLVTRKTEIYIDDLGLYASSLPADVLKEQGKSVSFTDAEPDPDSETISSNAKAKEYMGDAAALYMGKKKIYKDGKAESIPNAPIFSGSEAYIPASALTACGLSQNGATAKTINSVLYYEATSLAEKNGKKLTLDKSGLMVIGERENFFNFKTDIPIYRRVCGEIVFEDVGGAEMVQNVSSRFPQNEHPRLYANRDKINELKNTILTDSTAKARFNSVKRIADSLVTTDTAPVEYKLTGVRLLHVSRKAKIRLERLAFCYKMTGEAKYADRCIDELRAIIAFPDWNPYHFLDVAEMMEGVSFAYDWLYDYEGFADIRSDVRNALRDKGLRHALEDYRNISSRERSYKWAQSKVGDNWNIVCNSGAIQTAAVLADEEPEIAAEIFSSGMELIKKAILLYAPDGAWYEGVGYWQYTTDFYTDFISALLTSCGTDFGYCDAPGVKETGYFSRMLCGPCGNFNFHDSTVSAVYSPGMLLLAQYFGDAALQTTYLSNTGGGNIRDIIWYNKDFSANDADLPLDCYYRDTEVAVFRSGFGSRDIYAGFHAGKTNVYHGHMDAGSFVIDACGTRFACDLGSDDYDIPDSVWNLYRYRAEGHNTLVINPSKDGGQSLEGNAIMNRYEENRYGAFAITDLTSMYSENAVSVRRGMKMANLRGAIIVQDEIKADSPVDVRWYMHTAQSITVSADKKSARIKGTYDKDMLVSLLDTDIPAEFSVMDARPLETSPQNNAQSTNDGFRKLALSTTENVKEITIPVVMQLVPSYGSFEPYMPEVLPLDSWRLDNAEEGFKAKSVKAEEISGEVLISIDYSNTENEKNSVLIAAEYDGDRLSGIHISKSMKIQTGFGTLSFSYKGKLKKNTKLMIWDSISGIKPICEALSIN